MKKIILTTIIFLSNLAVAESFNLEQCLEQADSNVAMKECVQQDYEIADQQLNIHYHKLIQVFSADLKDSEPIIRDMANQSIQRLRFAQRAWIAFRDAQCNFEGISMLGGTGESLIVGGCLSRMTKERTSEIQKALQEFGSR